jgi:hypothetical protein
VDSSLHTTAELLADQGKIKKYSKDRGLAQSLPALGREFLSLDDHYRAQKTDISSRRMKACVIPAHMNVQYVEVF